MTASSNLPAPPTAERPLPRVADVALQLTASEKWEADANKKLSRLQGYDLLANYMKHPDGIRLPWDGAEPTLAKLAMFEAARLLCARGNQQGSHLIYDSFFTFSYAIDRIADAALRLCGGSHFLAAAYLIAEGPENAIIKGAFEAQIAEQRIVYGAISTDGCWDVVGDDHAN